MDPTPKCGTYCKRTWKQAGRELLLPPCPPGSPYAWMRAGLRKQVCISLSANGRRLRSSTSLSLHP